MTTVAPKVNGRTPRVAAARMVEPDPGGLMDALLKVAAQAPKLTRNADGQVGGRTYKYVDLDALLDAVMPLLVEHELVWMTRPTTDEHGHPALRYTLTHVPSGEFEQDVMPLLGATDSQTIGSAITYGRRYALLAMLNLAPGDDDDGAAASVNASNSVQQNGQNLAPVDRYGLAVAAHAQLPQPVAAAPKPSERPATAPQRNMLRAKARAAELGAGAFANVLKLAGGDQPAQWSDEASAERWADRALDRLPARLVDAVIEGIEGPRS